MKWLFAWSLSTLLALFPATEKWNVDTAAAKVDFNLKGPFGTVHGTFSGLKATISFNEKDLSVSSLKADIPVKTIKTGIGKRDSDLCNEETWFDVAKFPEITFVSKKIEKTGNGYKASGDLTMKGVTKPIEISFTFTNQGSAGEFKGEFTVKRADFGVGKSGGMVGSDVTVSLDVPVKGDSAKQ